MSDPINVLVTSAGRRVQLVRFFQRALADLRLGGSVVTTDLNPEWSAAARTADASFRSPPVSAQTYAEFLCDLVRREKIGLIVPTIDTELYSLALLRECFASAGCSVAISDPDLIAFARDKRLSNEWFQTIGCESPKMFDANRLSFPCFAKPFDGSLSRGARPLLTRDMASLDVLRDPRMMFMELFAPDQFDEYTIDTYYDRSGTLRCLVPRLRVEVRGGEISKGLTVRGALYDYLWPRLACVKGARGCLTFQFFASKSDERWVAIEVNPRFGGGYPLSYFAGANYPEWLLREYLLGQDIADFDGWREGTAMVRHDEEIIFRADCPQ